ncbi:MAG: TetR/AcrR family transcriptional regulator, partial [Treponemataceae bacterium]|nr:TetR/AcrR family transcriptional regulator [Treponemataceae bacterium]
MKQDDTRERLLHTAAALFSAQGYDAVGVQCIADAAGITKPTLYYYFGSKRGLLEALLSERGGAFLSALRAAAAYRRDFVLSLSELFRAMLSAAKDDPAFFRLHAALLMTPPESETAAVHKPFDEEVAAVFLGLFQKSAAEFGNMRGSEALFSAMFRWNLTALTLSALNSGAYPDDGKIHKIIRAFLYGIAS